MIVHVLLQIHIRTSRAHSPHSHLYLLGLGLGGLQGSDEVLVIHWVALCIGQPVEDLVLNLLQLLFHLSIADDKGILGFLEVWSLFCYHYTQ